MLEFFKKGMLGLRLAKLVITLKLNLNNKNQDN